MPTPNEAETEVLPSTGAAARTDMSAHSVRPVRATAAASAGGVSWTGLFSLLLLTFLVVVVVGLLFVLMLSIFC